MILRFRSTATLVRIADSQCQRPMDRNDRTRIGRGR
jgi:hypothetical protein